MPWKSVQQAKWGHSSAGIKALGGKDSVSEWDSATKKGSLPKTVRHPGALKKASEKVKGLSENKPNKTQKKSLTLSGKK